MSNQIMVIQPYWHCSTWCFDDPTVGLRAEPFVQGVPEILSRLVKDIPDARAGFRLLFSVSEFPGYQLRATKVRDDCGGAWYRTEDSEGWLCHALFKYFDQAPDELFVRAEPLSE